MADDGAAAASSPPEEAAAADSGGAAPRATEGGGAAEGGAEAAGNGATGALGGTGATDGGEAPQEAALIPAAVPSAVTVTTEGVEGEVALDALRFAGAPKRKRPRKPAESRRDNKRSKGGKDPLAPKKAKTAFICFCERERPLLMALFPGAPPTDITKKCGENWKKLSDEGRTPFVRLAEADKQRYIEMMKTYEPPPELLAQPESESNSSNKPEKIDRAPASASSSAVLQRAMIAEATATKQAQCKLGAIFC